MKVLPKTHTFTYFVRLFSYLPWPDSAFCNLRHTLKFKLRPLGNLKITWKPIPSISIMTTWMTVPGWTMYGINQLVFYLSANGRLIRPHGTSSDEPRPSSCIHSADSRWGFRLGYSKVPWVFVKHIIDWNSLTSYTFFRQIDLIYKHREWTSGRSLTRQQEYKLTGTLYSHTIQSFISTSELLPLAKENLRSGSVAPA